MVVRLVESANSTVDGLVSMSPMTRDGDATPAMEHDRPRRPPAFATALLWAGAVACVAGLGIYRLWEYWRPGRFGELLLIALAVAGLGWGLRRGTRWSQAGCQVLVLVAALAVFAGPLPLLAAGLLGLTGLAMGGLLGGGVPVAARCVCGLALLAGVVGWLLPLPVHSRWIYLALCLAVIAWRRRAVLDALRDVRAGWHDAIATAPRAAAWGVLALGLATTATWLPTLQADDLGYHLRLPWELQLRGRYAPDPWLHVWAVAPWASDVQHAIAQLLADREARGPLNALWIALTAAGVWRLCRHVGGSQRQAWIAVALYASLPLTAGLAGGMQTETAATALLVWLACLVLDPAGEPKGRTLFVGAVIVGGLFGLKLLAGMQGLLLIVWAAWLRRPWPVRGKLVAAFALALIVAGSSYVYAVIIAGNPFLPLFNAWFQSPYFDAANFDDARWNAGWSPWLPWTLTFRSADYHEGFAGAAGFVLVACAGAWLLALALRPTRALAVVSLAMLAITLLPLQYLRYAFPPMVLVLPALVSAATHFAPRSGVPLLAAVCVLNFAFQANAQWMLRTGALKQTVLHPGDPSPLYAQYAPAREAIAGLREQEHRNVLLIDDDAPWIAELGSRGRTTSWYAPTWQRAAVAADRDPSGTAWRQLWRKEQISHVLVRTGGITAAQEAALAGAGARPLASVGDIATWQLGPETAP
jgi:hypothetical protein